MHVVLKMTDVFVQTHSVRYRMSIGSVGVITAIWHRVELQWFAFNGTGNVKIDEAIIDFKRIPLFAVVIDLSPSTAVL